MSRFEPEKGELHSLEGKVVVVTGILPMPNLQYRRLPFCFTSFMFHSTSGPEDLEEDFSRLPFSVPSWSPTIFATSPIRSPYHLSPLPSSPLPLPHLSPHHLDISVLRAPSNPNPAQAAPTASAPPLSPSSPAPTAHTSSSATSTRLAGLRSLNPSPPHLPHPPPLPPNPLHPHPRPLKKRKCFSGARTSARTKIYYPSSLSPSQPTG